MVHFKASHIMKPCCLLFVPLFSLAITSAVYMLRIKTKK